MKNILIVIVPILFGIIHYIEISTFQAKLAGHEQKRISTGQTASNAIQMFTRFFFLIMLPILGLLIDTQISTSSYLLLFQFSILSAFLFSLFATYKADYLKNKLKNMLVKGISLNKLVKIQFSTFFSSKGNFDNFLLEKKFFLANKRFILLSGFIYFVYATSIFVAFYFSLIYYDYRASISQLSGVTNAFAAVLLAFYLEPELSRRIDESDQPDYFARHIILARIFGIFLLGEMLILTLFYFN